MRHNNDISGRPWAFLLCGLSWTAIGALSLVYGCLHLADGTSVRSSAGYAALGLLIGGYGLWRLTMCRVAPRRHSADARTSDEGARKLTQKSVTLVS